MKKYLPFVSLLLASSDLSISGEGQEVYRRCAPAVAHILVKLPIIPEYARVDRPDQKPYQGEGSGFAIGNGYTLLTCFHVDFEATAVIVTDRAGIEHQARLVRSDFDSDCSLIKIKSRLPTLKLARKEPRIGETIYTIGNPIGHRWLQTRGYFEKNQFIRFGGETIEENFFHIPINFGSSGGPLLNRQGEVVGMAQHFPQGDLSGQNCVSIPLAKLKDFLAGVEYER
jgi:S1-C subfamily serine protease